MIYLDNAATTPLLPEVKEEMNLVMDEIYGNPSSIHQAGRAARVKVEAARKSIADTFGVSPAEIFFTSGATESISMVLHSAVNDLGIKDFICSSVEHHAVLHTLESIEGAQEINIHFLKPDINGIITEGEVEKVLKKHPKSLVVLMHVNNETGVIQPMRKIRKLCESYGALYLSDTVQSIGKLKINLEKGPDFATCSAHKLHGPKGVGFLYKKGGITMKPLLVGGGQERNMRSGTENIIGISALAKAIEVAYNNLDETTEYIRNLKNYFAAEIKKHVPDAIIVGGLEQTIHTILNIAFPQKVVDDMFQYQLDIDGICVSGGSACSSGVSQASHVISEMGIPEDYINVRFSFSKLNTQEEIDQTLDIIKKLIS